MTGSPTVFLVLWVLPVVIESRESTIVLAENCPEKYHIQKPDGSMATVRMDKDCSRLERLRIRKKGRGFVAKEDLYPPVVTPVAVRGQYYAQIELQMVPGKDGNYSKKVFLELVTYNRTVKDVKVDETCLRFRVSNVKAEPHWGALKLRFRCLKLLDTGNNQIMLDTQMWTLPGGHSSSICRKTRSVGLTTTCGVRCSQKAIYPLSLAGENEYHLCSCADKERLNSTITTDNQVKVKLTGLPPFIGPIRINVQNISSATVYSTVINTSGARDNRAEFTITQTLPPGNYSIYIDGKCQFSREAGSREKSLIMDGIEQYCGHWPNIHAEARFDILVPDIPAGVPFWVIFGVLAGVIMIAIVTGVAFFIHHKKSDASSYAQQRSKREQDGVKLNDMTSFSEPTPRSHLLQLSNNTHERLSTNNSDSKPRPCMMLYHPDTPEYVFKLEEFKAQLDSMGVKVDQEKGDNWGDFAEGAVNHHSNILVFLSPGLVKLCECYKKTEKPAMQDPDFKKLIAERGYEYSPCVVMETIRTKVHECPERKDFLLHLISFCDIFDNSDELQKTFLKVYDFLNRTDNVNQCRFQQDPNDITVELKTLVEKISTVC